MPKTETQPDMTYKIVVSYTVHGKRQQAAISLTAPPIDIGDHVAAIIGEGKGSRLIIVPGADLRIESLKGETNA